MDNLKFRSRIEQFDLEIPSRSWDRDHLSGHPFLEHDRPLDMRERGHSRNRLPMDSYLSVCSSDTNYGRGNSGDAFDDAEGGFLQFQCARLGWRWER